MKPTDLCRIRLPASLALLKPLKAFTRELAQAIGFGDKDISHIELAFEEVLVNVVKYGFEDRCDKSFEVVFHQTSTGIQIRILEKGVPFSPDRLPDYLPDHPASADPEAGLGVYLAKTFMDEVDFIRLGGKGQEICLTKHLPAKRVQDLLNSFKTAPADNRQPADKKIDTLSPEDFSIRRMRPGEAVEISKCAYHSYGYTYEDTIYYPDRIAALNEEGKMYSLVAVSRDGLLLGHTALKFNLLNSPVAESAAAIVNPRFRNQGVFNALLGAMIEHGREIGLSGIYGQAVTIHDVSQRATVSHGFTASGVFLGEFSSTLDFKKIAGIPAQRESGLLCFLSLKKHPEVNVYPPRNHLAIIAECFKSLDLPVNITSAKTPIASRLQNKTDLEIVQSAFFNSAQIKIGQYGKETLSEIKLLLRHLCLERVDIVHLWLDLENPLTAELSPRFEKLGFFYGGLLPFGLFGRHALILQYLNNVKIDYGKIRIYDEEAAVLFKYIRQRNPLSRMG